MRLIPLEKIDAQLFNLTLQDTNYTFRLLDRGVAGVFLDVYQDGKPLISGILCLDRIRLIRSAYLEFPGDLIFADQEGFDPPNCFGFDDRFLLYYLEPKSDDGIGL